jgi:hypothetical protein
MARAFIKLIINSFATPSKLDGGWLMASLRVLSSTSLLGHSHIKHLATTTTYTTKGLSDDTFFRPLQRCTLYASQAYR